MNINFNQLIQKILPYSFIFLLAYLINSIAFFYLPKVGVEFKDNNIGNLEYKNYSGFYSKVQIVQESKEVKEVKSAPMENFSKYNLKGLNREKFNIEIVDIGKIEELYRKLFEP